MPIRVF